MKAKVQLLQLRSVSQRIAVSAALAWLTSCSGELPFYDLGYPPNSGIVVSVGPKVASLMANLKCELYAAVNDTTELTYYQDDPALGIHPLPAHGDDPVTLRNDRRNFTMQNIFSEIEYVGEALFQLDVTSTEAANPSAGFITPYHSAAANNLTLSVGAQWSEAGHRFIYQYVSVDFERLVDIHKGNARGSDEKILGIAERPTPCITGPQLAGSLGLAEDLGSDLTINAMNDISVWPTLASNSNASGSGESASTAPTLGSPTKIPVADNKYPVGQMEAQIDFTITSGVNGGENWTITHFKGPANSSSPLLNATRRVQDTLQISFLPVCIRQPYELVFPGGDRLQKIIGAISDAVKKKHARENGRISDLTIKWGNSKENPASLGVEAIVEKYPPFEYRRFELGGKPIKMVVGTPAWANYLKPCDEAAKTAGLVNARAANVATFSQRVPRSSIRF
jgi:hypothetical protein